MRRAIDEPEVEKPPKRNVRDRWFLALASLLMLGLIGSAVFAWRKQNEVKQKPKAEPPPVVAAVAPVSGAELSFAGAIAARNVVPLPAPIDGTIETLDVEDGAEVFEGQLLGRIKNEGLDAAREQAEKELEMMQSRIQNLESGLINARLELSRALADSQRAQSDFDRIDKEARRQDLLYKEGATPRLVYEKSQKDQQMAASERDSLREAARQGQQRVDFLTKDLDAAKRALEEKNKGLEAAKSDLQAAEVHSPVDGVLIAAKAKVGEQVDVTMKDLFTIAVAPEELEIRIEPEPETAKKLASGMAALVSIPELGIDSIEGEVAVDDEGRIFVEFASGEAGVKPGLQAIVKIKLP